MTSLPKAEILAPAGGWPQLRAALRAGADAVYVGAGTLNMRARAKNFNLEELTTVVETCHARGAKAYLAVNIQIYDADLPHLDLLLRTAKSAGVDAVIAADLAVILKAQALQLPVHISTQFSLSNRESLAFFHRMGIRRVVLARECTLEDLMRFRNDASLRELELEVFAHGAMCVAVSGRCFMSGFESGRSANRGACTQPCRREYRIESDRGGEGFRLSGQHVMSPQDLCTLPFVDQLLDAGVHSLKIEGRNRSPDYVHTVVSVYRRAVDLHAEKRSRPEYEAEMAALKDRGLTELKKVYNRGFSEGFYMGRPLGNWTTAPGSQSTHRRDYVGQILHMNPEGTRVTVRLESGGMREGEDLFAESPDLGYLPFTVSGLCGDEGPVPESPKGTSVTLPRRPYMHKGLKIYRMAPR